MKNNAITTKMSTILFSVTMLLTALSFSSQATYAQQKELTSFGKIALAESVIPIRPGIPGKSPFWNGYARQFIYAPAFDFQPVPKAVKYLFEILSTVDSSKYQFESDVPYAPLSKVWAKIPIGFFNLKVTGISENGSKLAAAGEGTYYRAAYFNGVYHKPVLRYDESAKMALDNLLQEDFVIYWFEHKKPDPSYRYYRYPAKIMSSLIVGAVTQARLKQNTADKKRFTQLARIIADYLISVSFEKGKPLEYFPPTYMGYPEIFKKSNPTIKTDDNLIIAAAEAGNAYLDLYDITSDQRYLEAAKRIAQTYRKTQLRNGSWYLFVNMNSGKNTAPNIAIPTSTINYFDRLKRDYKVTGYETATAKALQWIMENPVKTFDWHGQFEDITARPPYQNQSREQACDLAIYLLNNSKGKPQNLALAEELIRFSEDQFVMWEKPLPDPKPANNPGRKPENWITPVVQEQFAYWMPVGRAAGIMMETYRKAYHVTGKEIYMAKARSIANAFTVVQNSVGGSYPTYFTKYPNLGFWLNSAVYPAKMMMLLQNDMGNSN